jgi:hypothetical protein
MVPVIDVELLCGFHINRSDGRGRNRYPAIGPGSLAWRTRNHRSELREGSGLPAAACGIDQSAVLLL